ncbi:hypothetical protein I7I48_11187 [Histoplasma ohiense]|nr:hypothetical protein I7I48_11187 [Histoplasma ohiense (nom. inval.)]
MSQVTMRSVSEETRIIQFFFDTPQSCTTKCFRPLLNLLGSGMVYPPVSGFATWMYCTNMAECSNHDLSSGTGHNHNTKGYHIARRLLRKLWNTPWPLLESQRPFPMFSTKPQAHDGCTIFTDSQKLLKNV